MFKTSIYIIMHAVRFNCIEVHADAGSLLAMIEVEDNMRR